MLTAITGDGSPDEHIQVILMLGALLSTLVAALVYLAKSYINTKIAAEQSTEANKAVNNVGPGDHRLYDKISSIEKNVEHLIRDQETFDSHGWETLPQDLGTAVGLTTTIRDLQHGHKEQGEKLDEIKSILIEHVEREMRVKYPEQY